MIADPYPLTFRPIFKERVWGGRNLQRLFGKSLPEGQVIGESWEICDRDDDNNVVANGPLEGNRLRDVMAQWGADLMGESRELNGRFPLLVKLLDAQEKLSLQVHPPAALASRMGGEPKTEMWYIADARTDADLYVGLRQGVSRQGFEERIREGGVADCFHRIPVAAGDAMFLPSGRVHAIGAGNVIVEIQQNSDTTYRLHDWDRVVLEGRPRELHLSQSLASIDFEDYEPALVPSGFTRETDGVTRRILADCDSFRVEQCCLQPGAGLPNRIRHRVTVLGVVAGRMVCRARGHECELAPGSFCLLPAGLDGECLSLNHGATCLIAEAG